MCIRDRERFATAQANHRREGWRIVSTEELLAHPLEVDGQIFTITGKIDRVDQHEETGQVAIWDYKTSDKGEGPYKSHKTRTKWKDLQLPLYRHLVKEVAAVKNANLDTITLGYVLLSKNLDDIKFEAANFSITELKEADELAFDCIRKIRKGLYWTNRRGSCSQPRVYRRSEFRCSNFAIDWSDSQRLRPITGDQVGESSAPKNY